MNASDFGVKGSRLWLGQICPQMHFMALQLSHVGRGIIVVSTIVTIIQFLITCYRKEMIRFFASADSCVSCGSRIFYFPEIRCIWANCERILLACYGQVEGSVMTDSSIFGGNLISVFYSAFLNKSSKLWQMCVCVCLQRSFLYTYATSFS